MNANLPERKEEGGEGRGYLGVNFRKLLREGGTKSERMPTKDESIEKERSDIFFLLPP